MAVKWTLLSDDDQSRKLIELLMQGIPHETKEHAEYVIKELRDTFQKINDIQQDFLDGKHPNSVNWLAAQLDEIAKKHQLDSDELYDTVLSSLLKSNQNALKSLSLSDIPLDERDWHTLPPENAIQRDEALKEIDWLHESLAKCHLGQILDRFLRQQEQNNEPSDPYYRKLVEKALKTKFLSMEETALKLEFAVQAYIELRNNSEFKGLAMAEAVKQAMIYVTNLKYGYKKQQRGQLAAALKKYVKSAYLATTKVLLEKVPIWCADLFNVLLKVGTITYVSSEVCQLIKALSAEDFTKKILLGVFECLFIPRTYKWFDRHLKPEIRRSFEDLGKEVLPSLRDAAKDSLEKANKDIRSIGVKIRRAGMNICKSLTSVWKNWLNDENEEESVPEETENEDESEDEIQSEDEDN